MKMYMYMDIVCNMDKQFYHFLGTLISIDTRKIEPNNSLSYNGYMSKVCVYFKAFIFHSTESDLKEKHGVACGNKIE